MSTNSSSARKARRNNGAGYVENQGYERPAQAAREAGAPPVRERPSAAFRVPLVEAHLCAGDRRHQGRDAGVRLVAGKGHAHGRQYRRQHRRGEGGRQASGGACGEEGRQGSGIRSRRLSLSRARQGAGGCGARERTEILEHDPERQDRAQYETGLNDTRTGGEASFRDWKEPWQRNANAADANGAGSARSATASWSTSWSTSIAWRRSSRAANASDLRHWW